MSEVRGRTVRKKIGPPAWVRACQAQSIAGVVGFSALLLFAATGLLPGLLYGCSKAPGGAKRIPRDRDAQAVVVVDSPETVAFVAEREPNNEPAQASRFAIGGGVRGHLDGDIDVDTYEVAVETAGVLSARLSGIEGVDLILDLLAADGERLVRSDRGPAQVVEGIANFPVQPGRYHLAVREFIKKRRGQRDQNLPPTQGRTGASPTYELTAEVTAGLPADYEREPNDSADGAVEVLIGDEVFGYIGWARDTDLWKLALGQPVDQQGLDLVVDAVPGVGLTIEILDGGGTPLIRRKGGRGLGVAVRNLVLAAADAGSGGATEPYYARITARRSNPLDAYRLHLTTRLLDLDEETEPNDQSQRALPLRERAQVQEGMRRGYLTVGDVDYYRLETGDTPVLLTVDISAGEDLNPAVAIVAGGDTLGTAEAGKRGGNAYLPDVRLAAGQIGFVKVAGQGSSGPNASYKLAWSVEPAKPVAEELPVEDTLFGDSND